MKLGKWFFSIGEYRELLKDILTPDEIYETVEDINIEDLFYKGYGTIFLDIDNTILKYSKRELSLQKVNWIERLKGIGFRIFLISNNISRSRVHRVAQQLKIEGLYFSLKPFNFCIKEFSQRHYIDFKKTIVIGDQLLTDVLFGNWLKSHTILVDPLDKKVSFIKTLQREVELFILKKLDVYYDFLESTG